MLVILGGLGYIGWYAFQPKAGGGGRGGAGARLDLPVPVLAANPRTQDVPFYPRGVCAVRPRPQLVVSPPVGGNILCGNFTEGPAAQSRRRLG